MLVNNKNYQTIWVDEDDQAVIKVIDQRKLPFEFVIKELRTVEDVFNAIDTMTVRGAPLIGAAAAFGIYLATFGIKDHSDPYGHLEATGSYLISCRPTAVNLSWSVKHVLGILRKEKNPELLPGKALEAALGICRTENENCRQIGIHGLKLIEDISRRKNGDTVNILTHCNAGWLACIDYGTVTAPIYLARELGIKIHVWVDETRPRNQGSKLTAWELGQNDVPYTLIADNTGGHLMQHGMVDIVIVGSDRTTACGDVANKIGTYLKALAAFDNNIPFYSVFPSTSIDFSINDGIQEIVVEERNSDEVTTMTGIAEGKIATVRICPGDAEAANYGFDVTPARLITGIVTERGICRATREDIRKMFPDKIR